MNTIFSGGIKYKSDETQQEADKLKGNLKKGLIGKLNLMAKNISNGASKELESEEEDLTYKYVRGYATDVKRDFLSKGYYDDDRMF